MSIYLDNNATTRPLDSVIEAVNRTQRDYFANASSQHAMGRAVKHQLDLARQQVALLVGAAPKEIVFTSGGTESINLAIRGLLASAPTKRHLVMSAVEHSVVRRLASRLEGEGYVVDEVGVNGRGDLDLDELDAKIGEQTALVSIMHANHETGILFDIDRVVAVASKKGVPIHVDAVQSAGKASLDVKHLPVSLMSFSGHKLHGPKGVGALYVRRGIRLRSQLLGGEQERGLRAGTENVPGIVGFGVAAEAAFRSGVGEYESIRGLRDDLETRVRASIPSAVIIGDDANRLCNTSCIGFPGLAADAIVHLLNERGIAVSAGAACSSGSLGPSLVLKAMGIPQDLAHGAVRFSLSRFSTQEEVDKVVEVLPAVVSRVSALRP